VQSFIAQKLHVIVVVVPLIPVPFSLWWDESNALYRLSLQLQIQLGQVTVWSDAPDATFVDMFPPPTRSHRETPEFNTTQHFKVTRVAKVTTLIHGVIASITFFVRRLCPGQLQLGEAEADDATNV
jgi:hypothetical protein